MAMALGSADSEVNYNYQSGPIFGGTEILQLGLYKYHTTALAPPTTHQVASYERSHYLKDFPRETLPGKSERLFPSVKSWNLANNIYFKYLKRVNTSHNVFWRFWIIFILLIYMFDIKNILIIIMYFISKNMVNWYHITLQTAYIMMAIRGGNVLICTRCCSIAK